MACSLLPIGQSVGRLRYLYNLTNRLDLRKLIWRFSSSILPHSTLHFTLALQSGRPSTSRRRFYQTSSRALCFPRQHMTSDFDLARRFSFRNRTSTAVSCPRPVFQLPLYLLVLPSNPDSPDDSLFDPTNLVNRTSASATIISLLSRSIIHVLHPISRHCRHIYVPHIACPIWAVRIPHLPLC